MPLFSSESSETHTHLSLGSVCLINMEDIFIKVIGSQALFSLRSAQVESLFGITSPLCQRLITPDAIRHVVLFLFFIAVITRGEMRKGQRGVAVIGVESGEGSRSLISVGVNDKGRSKRARVIKTNM